MTQDEVDRLEGRMVAVVRDRPAYYSEILRALPDADYRGVMLAFGQIRRKRLFGRDPQGRYTLAAAS